MENTREIIGITEIQGKFNFSKVKRLVRDVKTCATETSLQN